MTTQAATRQDLARSGLRRPGGGRAVPVVLGWPTVPAHPPAATLARGAKAGQRAVQVAGRGAAGRLFPPLAEIRNRALGVLP